MGFWDSTKNVLGIGSGGSDDVDEQAEEWADELDAEWEESEELMEEEDWEEEEEAELREWESAYAFAEEYLEMRGFSSMMDFTNKCMAFKVNQSPMYRDRIKTGVDTMNRITTMQEQMSKIGGGNKQRKSYKETAEELKAANEVIDQAQKLNGQEDAIVNEALMLGQDLVEAIGTRASGGTAGGNVNSRVNSVDEEL